MPCKHEGGTDACVRTLRGVCKIYRKQYRTSKLCEHGRQRQFCKECGGSGICEHNRQRQFCKECGGSGICEHNRQRYYCSACEPESVLGTYEANAIKRGYVWEITKEQGLALLAGACAYCKRRTETMGIDRVDNAVGYVLGNVVSCCKACNMMKRAYRKDEFVVQCARVAMAQLQAFVEAHDADLRV